MSPKNKKKLNIQRKKLDILDKKLLNIIKTRTQIIKKVMFLKTNRREIVDKKRIAFILRKIKPLCRASFYFLLLVLVVVVQGLRARCLIL